MAKKPKKDDMSAVLKRGEVLREQKVTGACVLRMTWENDRYIIRVVGKNGHEYRLWGDGKYGDRWDHAKEEWDFALETFGTPIGRLAIIK